MADLARHQEAIERIARSRGASAVRVTGSVARGDARPDSDIDLVVTMADDRTALDLSELILDLQNELGRRVDVLAVPAHRPRTQGPPPGVPTERIVANSIPLGATPTSGSNDHDRRLAAEIVHSIALVRAYTTGDLSEFVSNKSAVDATRYRLAAIAEACNRLSGQLKTRHPEIAWRALGGLGALVSHGPPILWEIAQEHLSTLDEVVAQES
jgi:predicted nucleotidyltransferase/uncharacterized protein with HEPN domain